MSDNYTRRDYALDDPDSMQSKGVSATVNGDVHEVTTGDLRESTQSPGHDSDDAAVAGYCPGSRDTREPDDAADEWAAKFSDL